MYDRILRGLWQREDPNNPTPEQEPEKPSLERSLAEAGWRDIDWHGVEPPAGKPYAVAQTSFLAGHGRAKYVRLNTGEIAQWVGFADDAYSVPAGF